MVSREESAVERTFSWYDSYTLPVVTKKYRFHDYGRLFIYLFWLITATEIQDTLQKTTSIQWTEQTQSE